MSRSSVVRFGIGKERPRKLDNLCGEVLDRLGADKLLARYNYDHSLTV